MSTTIAGTMFHKSGTDWTRCIATKKPGQGVSDCPVFTKGLHVSSHGLAGLGGGTTRRSERSSVVEEPDEANVYAVKGPKRTQYHDGETGRMITWRDRQKRRLKFKQLRRSKVAGPSVDVMDANKAPEDFKKLFASVEQSFGTKITEYNRDEVIDATEYAYAQASAYFYSNPDPVKAREARAGFHRAVIYNLLVEKQSPREAVDGVLERANLGPKADINKVHPSKRVEHIKRVEKQRIKDIQEQINNRARKQEEEKEHIRNEFQIIDEVPEEVEGFMEKLKATAAEAEALEPEVKEEAAVEEPSNNEGDNDEKIVVAKPKPAYNTFNKHFRSISKKHKATATDEEKLKSAIWLASNWDDLNTHSSMRAGWVFEKAVNEFREEQNDRDRALIDHARETGEIPTKAQIHELDTLIEEGIPPRMAFNLTF